METPFIRVKRTKGRASQENEIPPNFKESCLGNV